MTQKLSTHGLPIAPEVCKDCEQGIHVCHIIHELADISVTTKMVKVFGSNREHEVLSIQGYADDPLWLQIVFEAAHHMTKELPLS
jgi:hypothetical protein